MMQFILGQKFGNLTIVKFLYIRKTSAYWLCKCCCGNECEVSATKLNKGKIKSCGCLRRETCFKFKGYKQISSVYWHSIKGGAKERNIEFNLTIEEAWEQFEKQNGKCALSGVELKFATKAFAYEQTASLDRINSIKCYDINNIQWIHKDINKMKSNLKQEDFIRYCIKIKSANDAKNNKI